MNEETTNSHQRHQRSYHSSDHGGFVPMDANDALTQYYLQLSDEGVSEEELERALRTATEISRNHHASQAAAHRHDSHGPSSEGAAATINLRLMSSKTSEATYQGDDELDESTTTQQSNNDHGSPAQEGLDVTTDDYDDDEELEEKENEDDEGDVRKNTGSSKAQDALDFVHVHLEHLPSQEERQQHQQHQQHQHPPSPPYQSDYASNDNQPRTGSRFSYYRKFASEGSTTGDSAITTGSRRSSAKRGMVEVPARRSRPQPSNTNDESQTEESTTQGVQQEEEDTTTESDMIPNSASSRSHDSYIAAKEERILTHQQIQEQIEQIHQNRKRSIQRQQALLQQQTETASSLSQQSQPQPPYENKNMHQYRQQQKKLQKQMNVRQKSLQNKQPRNKNYSLVNALDSTFPDRDQQQLHQLHSSLVDVVEHSPQNNNLHKQQQQQRSLSPTSNSNTESQHSRHHHHRQDLSPENPFKFNRQNALQGSIRSSGGRSTSSRHSSNSHRPKTMQVVQVNTLRAQLVQVSQQQQQQGSTTTSNNKAGATSSRNEQQAAETGIVTDESSTLSGHILQDEDMDFVNINMTGEEEEEPTTSTHNASVTTPAQSLSATSTGEDVIRQSNTSNSSLKGKYEKARAATTTTVEVCLTRKGQQPEETEEEESHTDNDHHPSNVNSDYNPIEGNWENVQINQTNSSTNLQHNNTENNSSLRTMSSESPPPSSWTRKQEARRERLLKKRDEKIRMSLLQTMQHNTRANFCAIFLLGVALATLVLLLIAKWITNRKTSMVYYEDEDQHFLVTDNERLMTIEVLALALIMVLLLGSVCYLGAATCDSNRSLIRAVKHEDACLANSSARRKHPTYCAPYFAGSPHSRDSSQDHDDLDKKSNWGQKPQATSSNNGHNSTDPYNEFPQAQSLSMMSSGSGSGNFGGDPGEILISMEEAQYYQALEEDDPGICCSPYPTIHAASTEEPTDSHTAPSDEEDDDNLAVESGSKRPRGTLV